MKTVLVTGATGAIGSALVPLFLEEEGTRVRLLIRARSEEHLGERLEELFAFWELGAEESQLRSRVRALRGDLTLPRLGMSGEDYDLLAAEVTHVIHAAGNVKLNRPMDKARRCAVGSLENIIAFCRDAKRFEKLDCLSTVGVGGRTPGLLLEKPLTAPREFHNTYEAAKAEAEEVLLAAVKEGLPATVHRPSMVVGDSRNGKIISFQVFYYLAEFLTGRKTWGVVPETGGRTLDIVPVDYVARAIHLASGSAAATGRVFHLCSGPKLAPKLSDLTERLREIATGHGVRLPRLKRLRPETLKIAVSALGRVLPGKTGRALRSLPHFLNYLDEDQAFDNTASREFFEELNLRLPNVQSCLPALMSAARASKTPRGEGAPTHASGKPLRACSREDCARCGLAPKTSCHQGARDIFDFMSLAATYFIPFLGGMIAGGHWLGLGIWGLLAVFFFLYAQQRLICRRCPHYAEHRGVLTCHAAFGLPKIPRYAPKPMSRAERVVLMAYTGALFLYYIPFFAWSGQWLLLAIASWALLAWAWTVQRHLCVRCVNLYCPFNRAPRDVRSELVAAYPDLLPALQGATPIEEPCSREAQKVATPMAAAASSAVSAPGPESEGVASRRARGSGLLDGALDRRENRLRSVAAGTRVDRGDRGWKP